MSDKMNLTSGPFYIDEDTVLAMTSEDLFNIIDGPGHISVHDLLHKVERSQNALDPERERRHQERLKMNAAFIASAQVVIDAYTDDSKPHPKWSERQLRRTQESVDAEKGYYCRQRDYYADKAPDFMIEWKSIYKDVPVRLQRNDEYQVEVKAKISALQETIDQCIAIMDSRGIEVSA
jgi:hypothetical protein